MTASSPPSRLRCHATPLAGVWEIETLPIGDERGRFTRLFCQETLAAIGSKLEFVQINHSYTAQRGTVRGLHLQRAPAQETKLIRCLRGRVFDVAVDLRQDSPTWGHWHAVELSEDNQRQILIPEGCAHGFQSLTDNAELLYMHTNVHTPGCESGVRHDDPALDIAWPLPVTVLSDRDRQLPSLHDLRASLST